MYADSGATTHVTYEPNKLNQKTDYNGKETLGIADGTQLKIVHVGNTFLPSTTNHMLKLDNILHVPRAAKNIVYTSKLTKDNDVIVEFHP